MIVAQIEAVASDIGVDAVKVGMLGTTETIEAVIEGLGIVRRRPGGGRPGHGLRDRIEPARRRSPLGPGRRHPAAGEFRHAEHPRGPCARRPRPRILTGGPGPGGACARSRLRGRHRWPQRRPGRLFYDGSEIHVEIEGPRYHAPPPTVPAAPTPRRSPAISPSGWISLSRRSARREPWPPSSCRNGLDSIGDGPGPVDVIGLNGELPH